MSSNQSCLSYKPERCHRLMLRRWFAARHPVGRRNASGERHGESKRSQHQEEAEVQELRGQGPAEEGRQGGKMPALRRDGGSLSSYLSLARTNLVTGCADQQR